jgi:Protein of unknown function (DUF664)
MTTYARWEPPFDGSEVEHVLGSLDRLRWTFRWKLDGLDAAGITARLAPSTLTLGGLLKHLALQEEYASGFKVRGTPLGPPWGTAPWDDDPDWEFSSAGDDVPERLYALYDAAVVKSRAAFAAAISDGGLGQHVHGRGTEGPHWSLRRVLWDLVEEYGRHTGQADLIREAVDGRVGEDPPPEFHVAGW